MDNEVLAQALVKVEFSDGFQTGFIFTDYGHILTTGHGFTHSDIGEAFFVVFESPFHSKYSATLLQFEFDESSYEDFAILKISNDGYYQENRIKLELRKFHGREDLQKTVFLAGYTVKLNEKVASHFEGRILGTNPIASRRRKNKFWLQMKIDSQLSLKGLSGAPVIVNNKVVGIQNGQAFSASNDCYATAINCIDSLLIKDELMHHNDRFYLRTHHFEKAVGEAINEGKKRVRYVLLASDYFNKDETVLLNSLNDIEPKEKFNQRLKKAVEKIRSIIKRRLPELDIVWVPCSHDEISNLNSFMQTFDTKFDNFSKRMRCMIDFGSHVPNLVPVGLLNSGGSLVGIELHKQLKNSVEVSSKQGFDSYFRIGYNEHGFAKQWINEIVLGIALDIIYFWSIPGFHFLIRDRESQRSVGIRKVSFAQDQRKKIFGKWAIPSDTGYLSFAWVTKDKFADYLSYINTWRTFLDGSDGFFEHLQGSNAPLSTLTKKELVDHLMSTAKIAGQISLKRLKGELGKLQNSLELTLSAIVILMKPPGNNLDRKRVLQIFKGTKNKSFVILPVSHLRPAMAISHLVKLYYFILKDSK